MLKVNALQKGYGGTTVLADATFTLGNGQHGALVGYNGTGKTTILRILAGLLPADGGTVEVGPQERIGYLPQDTSVASDLPVLEFLREATGIAALERELATLSEALATDEVALARYGEVMETFERLQGYQFEHRANTMLDGFGLPEASRSLPVSSLSSGQRHKIGLVNILLQGAEVLLLDEPTNNLDLPAVVWLEEFLRASKRTVLVVSHDRRFIDRVADKIIELDWHTRKVSVTNGNYSAYLEMQARRRAGQLAAYEAQQEEIGRLSARADALRARSTRGASWSGRDNDKFLRGFKRDRAAGSGRAAGALEQRIEQMDRVERPQLRDPLRIDIGTPSQEGKHDIDLSAVVAGYPHGHVVGPVSLMIPFGARLGIMGTNGTGKTTLLKTLTGHTEPLSGSVRIGSDVRIGDMMQEHESLPRHMSPVRFLQDDYGFLEMDAYNLLARFRVTSHERAEEPIATLSPGARARLLIGLFSARQVNVLVLDEPTNHLDLEAAEALEDALVAFRGTIILVSHDRYFIEALGLTSLYELRDGQLNEIPDFSTYLAHAEARTQKLLRLL
jgi:ATP-binding cassette subfamily F protein 3